jgi:phosphoribosylglycinamide formyltransferase-1
VAARIVVLVSGTGSNLAALIEAADEGQLPAEIVAVVSDRPEVLALERAEAAGIPTQVVAPGDFADRGVWDEALAAALAAARPDLVVSAGFMRLLGPAVLGAFPVVNTHPALLPAFPGTHAVADALAYGVTVTGCTVHWVDDGVDTGPILAQAPVAVKAEDTEAELHERIKTVERLLLVEVVSRLVSEGWTLDGRKTRFGSE